MRKLSLCLDALPALREMAGLGQMDLTMACSLAELANVDRLRIGIGEDLRPVSEADVQTLRRSTRFLELRMPPAQSLLKVALESRPDAVVLADGSWEGTLGARPIELRSQPSGLAPVMRSLEESGIRAALLITPSLEAVKAAHGLGVRAVEFYTGATVDLPSRERRPGLDALSDAAKLASKLRMTVSVGGGLDYRSVTEVLPLVSSARSVTVGRAVMARSLLVGIDRAARDFLDLIR